MKREDGSLFANFFSGRSGSKEAGTSREVVTNPSAQPHVLREKMKEKELTHGETVMVNMSPVQLEGAFGRMHLYFCPMKNLDVIEKITAGDGGDIPLDVEVEGLTVPKDKGSGFYALKNVKLTSNGSMQVIATPSTTWESVLVKDL